MIFDLLNKLPVVNDFEAIYGQQLCTSYPVLSGLNIHIYADEQENGWIKQWDDSNNSPYTSNHLVNEIMRSEVVCNQCNFTREEEFAILAHELGHIVAGKLGLKSANRLQEEQNADQVAVSLGLAAQMKSALQKMINMNINPTNNAEMQLRIAVL